MPVHGQTASAHTGFCQVYFYRELTEAIALGPISAALLIWPGARYTKLFNLAKNRHGKALSLAVRSRKIGSILLGSFG